ncbi:MAG: selenide, water dikinase SelD [Gemmatimonadales bacterium]
MSEVPTVRLTTFSHGAGCACKLGSLELAEVLRHLPPISDPRILVDAASRDDAAVFRLDAERALIATVDFFTPVVDDAYDWGRITAANALSDIYAMGGRPLFALNLVGWPRGKLPFELLGEVLRGAADIAAQAGCLLVGGHSVDDPEPKFGLAVIGEAHPDRVLTNAVGRAGDVLILTKPLGTGILSTALKRERIDGAAMTPAVKSMTTLNDGAARAALAHGVRCATDVTGFGLLGHLGNILRSSALAAEIFFESLPLLPRARELAEAGVVPGGTERNYKAAEGTAWEDGLSQAERILCCDAQTSGGLLLAVAPERAEALVGALRAEQTPVAAIIGQLVAGPAGAVSVRRRGGT